MNTTYASLLTLALAFSGMAALAFAMDRHHEQLTGQRQAASGRVWVLRVFGSALLIAAIVPCVMGWGATVGTVAWLGFISAGALLAVVGIGYATRWSAGVAGALGVSALLALVLQALVG